MGGEKVEELIDEVIDIEDKELLIDEIMRRYGQEILQLVYSYVKNGAIAEDLTQEIFIKCYQHLHTYTGQSKLKTWLWRIAINHSKDYLKSWYKQKVIVSETEFTQTESNYRSIEDSVIQHEEDGELVSAVMNLPVKYREVIYLFYFEEMAIREISRVTDQKGNTVKTRLKRAKELLKKQLGGMN
jgi:RNA polymerase sigma-70 factor, ECF subfamily